jgi:hypothetical protein
VKRSMMRILLPAAAAAALAACGPSEELNPVPVSTTSSSSSTGGAPPGTGGGGAGGSVPHMDGGLKKRSLEQRNPFGNVAETENLLWDGDFEWSSAFSDQYGWLSGPPYSYAFDNVRVGVMCRSGLKCAAIKKNKAILGIGVASQGNKLYASFWAHLTQGTCDQVEANVASVFDPGEADAPVAPVSMTPDDRGWCHYESVVDARVHKPFLFIVNKTPDEIIVDDAVLKRALDAKAKPHAAGPPTAEHAAAIAEAREAMRARRGPHDPPPNAARKAFESWTKR